MAETTTIFREVRRYGLAGVLSVSLAFSVTAQKPLNPNENQFADLCKAFSTKLNASIANTRIPGATAAIVLPDGRVCTAVVGLTRISNGRKLTPEDPILAASIGKTFVSALAMQLVEEGKLDLDKNITYWFATKPWFARLPNARDITVRMLMNHSSGIPNHVEEKTFVSVETKDFDKDVPFEYLLTFILGKRPLFAAGKGYYYADTNYFLLAMIEEQITGTTMYDEVTARFLKPLRLDHTMPANKNLDPAVYGYYENQPVVKKGRLIVNPQWEWAGGGFWSTPTDLARWANALYSGKVLKPESLDKMIKSTSNGEGKIYGLGVEVLNTKMGTSYGHDGDWPGYLSVMRYYPKYGIAVASQINAGGIPEAEKFIETIADDLAVVFVGPLARVRLSPEERSGAETLRPLH
jgi:D-alanyl-D-alanine carboxypeptidase